MFRSLIIDTQSSPDSTELPNDEDLIQIQLRCQSQLEIIQVTQDATNGQDPILMIVLQETPKPNQQEMWK